MQLHTERLILRPWRDTDAADLYEYARDPRVGPIAGWPVHTSVEESTEIIRTVFNQPEVYALQNREDGRAIGCVGILIGADSNFEISDRPRRRDRLLDRRTVLGPRPGPRSGARSDAACIPAAGAGSAVVRLLR